MIAALAVVSVVIVALLVIAGVFSAAETSLTAASRGRMHLLEREGDKAARRVNLLISDQETMIGAVLLCYNLINILSSALATYIIEKLEPGPWGVALATVVMTALVVVFVEVLPKTLAIVHPDDVARSLSGPMLVTVRLLGPVIFAVQTIVRRVLSLFGVDLNPQADSNAAHEEIRGAVDYHHAEGAVESGDRKMLGGVLDLGEVTVAEVMVHRQAMSMIDGDLPASEIVERVLEADHSRLPIWRGEPDNIVGVLHTKDVLRAIVRVGAAQVDIATLIREPWFIPETTHLKEQLDAFLKLRQHAALVVDEYGALQGLITLEDILEEIVGEIEDEHDGAIQGVRRQSDGWVVVDGDVTVRDLNRAFDWDLPDDHAVTVAGLVIHEARVIPEPGQTFGFHGHRFRILRRQRNQITQLAVSPPSEALEG
ncbi:MAG TPA: HlyC/CorC family transporter [Caulobacteraceae bacterium]|jgi:Mg2+/Co2+ transporter CorB